MTKKDSFTTGQILDLSANSYRTLDHWVRSGFLTPSIRNKKGCWRTYSIGDVVAMFTANLGRRVGISLHAMSKLIPHLQNSYSAVEEIKPKRLSKNKDVIIFVEESGKLHLYADERLSERMSQCSNPVMGVFALGAIEGKLYPRLLINENRGWRPRGGGNR